MRKLVVLMLVLGMASLANAGVISLVGPASMDPGTSATWKIAYSGSPADIQMFDVTIAVDALVGSLSNATITASDRLTDYDYIGENVAGQDYELAGMNDTAGMYLGHVNGALATITFTAGSTPGVYTIDPVIVFMAGTGFGDITGDTAAQGLEVTITPEPATMLILGLGGSD